MSVREWLNQRPAVAFGVTGAGVVIVGVIVVVLFWSQISYLFAGTGAEARLGDRFFVDSATGEIFTGSRAELIPPFERNGNTCYGAYVYTLDECRDGQWFVLLYEKYTDEAIQHMKGNNLTQPAIEPVVSTDMKVWRHMMMGETDMLTFALEAKKAEGGADAKPCKP